MTMPRACLALFVLALAVAPARAGDLVAVPLPAPASAAEFGISGASLTTFDGATLSLRRQRSAHAAWRYGLSVTGSFWHSDGHGAGTDTNTLPRVSDDDRYNRLIMGASLTRLTYPAPDAVIKPYFGVGLGGAWNESLDERTSTSAEINGALINQDYSSYHTWGPTYAAFALFGLEWVLNPRFSVHAEYGQSVSYAPTHSEQRFRNVAGETVTRRTETFTNRQWTLDARSVHAGLSVFY
jgi:hypothetical protein